VRDRDRKSCVAETVTSKVLQERILIIGEKPKADFKSWLRAQYEYAQRARQRVVTKMSLKCKLFGCLRRELLLEWLNYFGSAR
jgi:hypothetical protein